MSVTSVVPLSEYLTTTYRPDCEYIDGELLERNVGEFEHSNLQSSLIAYLRSRKKEWGIVAVVEQRVQVRATRFRVPDILILTEAPDGPIVQTPPFVCIEILSPSDRMAEMQDRIDDYLNFGVRYVWLINPATRRAFVYTTEGVREAKDGILETENPAIRVNLSELE